MPWSTRRKPEVKVTPWVDFFGSMSLANAAQRVWNPQGNDEGQPRRVVFLPPWYLSNTRREKLLFQASPQHFLGVLCPSAEGQGLFLSLWGTWALAVFYWVRLFLTSKEQHRWLNSRDLSVENMIIQKAFLEKFSQTGWMQSGTRCICPIQCTCNMVHCKNTNVFDCTEGNRIVLLSTQVKIWDFVWTSWFLVQE